MLLIAWMLATSILWYVVSQEAMTTMVDCNNGVQHHTMHQPTIYFCCIAGEWAVITKAQSTRDEIHHIDDDIIDAQ
jgi:hypothetical protein